MAGAAGAVVVRQPRWFQVLAVAAAVIVGFAGVIVRPWGVLGVLAAVVVAAWLIREASLVVVASRASLKVRNSFRTKALPWDRINHWVISDAVVIVELTDPESMVLLEVTKRSSASRTHRRAQLQEVVDRLRSVDPRVP